MLRGRCSCAISGRPTSSSFASPSLLCPLTPLFPLDASHSPVTPLFPLHTQKQGVPPSCGLTNRSTSGMHPLRPMSVSPSFSVLSASSAVDPLSAAFPRLPLACPPKLQRRRATISNHSRTIGNCCPTNRTRSNMYHYITCPLSARRHFRSCRRQRTNPRAGLKTGRYIKSAARPPCPVRRVNVADWGSTVLRSARRLVHRKAY